MWNFASLKVLTRGGNLGTRDYSYINHLIHYELSISYSTQTKVLINGETIIDYCMGFKCFSIFMFVYFSNWNSLAKLKGFFYGTPIESGLHIRNKENLKSNYERQAKL